MAEQNSLSTLLPELLRLFNNSLESFEKINQAITSNRDSVTVDLQGSDGNISKVTIPSFGFLKNQIDTLQSNINVITNVDGAGSSIRLADGTFRKLVLAKLPAEAQDLTALNSVNQFGFKSNWFFESLINPLLFVTFDVTGQVPIDTERAINKRYILELNTQSKKNFFNSNYKGRSDVDFDKFLSDLVERNISYVLDEAVTDLPPREKRYSGKFSVTRISETDFTEEVNGVTQTTQKKLYKLNKLLYSDAEANFSDTIQIKVGDSLEVVSNPVDTRYTVLQVDSSSNTVVLQLAEGSKAIGIGADVLKIGSSLNDQVEIETTVGFDEYCMVFIKPIDPNSKMPAVNWSPGVAFYTNELTTIDQFGTEQTLSNFYQTQAVDFGRFLLSFAQDKLPTSKEGVTPNAPTLVAGDFSVKNINKQVTDSDAIVQLQDLNNQKTSLESKLKELDTAIKQKRTRIQTTNYATEVERDADKNELQGLITDRSTQAELYASVVKEIAAKASDNSVSSVTPKYRVRGFFPMPEEKSTPSTGVQDLVKFKTRFRYLSQDGAANPVDQFSFGDGVGQSQAAFSNWEVIESVIRPRVKNNLTGQYEWATIDNEDADAVNINQVNIPIRKGEIVEMQILSVSEAGWPSNPLESAWSNSVRITFPADLSSDSAVESIVSQNREDLAKIALEEDLNAKGIDQHLASSFTANEQYFGHTAAAIASGFLSENQTPIDLFAKLTQMQGQLDTFNEILRRAQGKLKVTLIDDQGNVINLVKDTLNRVFAGYYSQEVSTLDDPRGAIVSKTFFISLENVEQTTLQLIARVTGNRGRMVKQSENPGFSVAEGGNGTVTLPGTYTWLDNSAASQSNLRPTYLTNDGDYNLQRKYDLTPILLINPEVQSAYGQDKSLPPFQSAQNKNQFIYSRFKDVSSEEEFYNYVNPEIEYVINLDTAENFYGRTGFSTVQTAGEFVWGGGFENDITPTTAAVLDDSVIEVHIEHPIVAKYEAFKAEYEQKTGDGITLAPPPAYPFNCTSTGNSTADVLFRQSKFAPLKSDDVRGKQQNIYLNENLIAISQIAIDPTLNYPSFGNPNMETPDGSPQVFQPSPSLAANTNLINVGVDYGRNTKNSFDTFDQYLLGKPSCGSYLFLSTEDHVNIQVDGDATTSFKPVQFGSSSALTVPLVFQYRMTDYFGDGSGVLGGLGNVGGDTTGATTNITYAKRVGFDVYPNNLDVFQYDIEVFSKYRPDGLNIDVFPTATLARGLNDLERVVSTLAPSITETAVNQQVRGEQGFTRRST
jgi:hypothetical protein